MAARSIDAAEGYRLFRRWSGNVELDEINEHLRCVSLALMALPQLPLGEPDSPEGQQLPDAAQSAIDLPLDTHIKPEPGQHPAMQEAE